MISPTDRHLQTRALPESKRVIRIVALASLTTFFMSLTLSQLFDQGSPNQASDERALTIASITISIVIAPVFESLLQAPLLSALQRAHSKIAGVIAVAIFFGWAHTIDREWYFVFVGLHFAVYSAVYYNIKDQHGTVLAFAAMATTHAAHNALILAFYWAMISATGTGL